MAAAVTAVQALPKFATVTYGTVQAQNVDVTNPRSQVDVLEANFDQASSGVIVLALPPFAEPPFNPPELTFSLETLASERFNGEIEQLAQLPYDFDGEGSPAYSSGTISAARVLVDRFVGAYNDEFGTALLKPAALPGPNGSIDLRWRSHRVNLLINVPSSVERSPAVYGMDPVSGDDISMRLEDDSSLKRLLRWVHDRWAAP